MSRFLSLLLLFTALAAAEEPRRIYLAEDEHTEFMWTADAETYQRVFVEMLDWHMQLAEKTQDHPAPYRHRFNCDGSYWLATYEQRKSPVEFARLIRHVKEGSISVPLNTLVSCYGGQSAEAVLRGMYYAGRLERRHGLRLPLAVAMENQTLPLGLASLFAGAGAKYSWRGVCGCASKLNNKTLEARPHEIFWWTGKDGRRVLLKWHSLAPAGNQHSGGYAEAFDPAKAIRYLDSDAGFLTRYRAPGSAEPFQVRGAFGFGWDALDRKTGQPYAPDPVKYPVVDHFHVTAERESNAARRVIVSNEQDFFEDFERTHGGSLTAQSVTHGNEWDLYSASMSETSARAKRAVEKLRAAEALAALVSLKQPGFMDRHTAARNRAYHAIGLFWEHNWTADGPITRPQRAAWQEQLASEIEGYVQTLLDESVGKLGGMISGVKKATRFFVFNPLGWSRTQHADFVFQGDAAVQVVDLSTGAVVSHQLVTRHGVQHLRVLASDVPSLGYKVFEVRPGSSGESLTAAATLNDDVFENEAVKLVIARDGAIRSLVDKRRGHTELAASIGGLHLNDFAANTDDGEPLHIENSGPVSVTVLARSAAGLAHDTRITLYRDSDRVDIENDLNANFSDVRHWAFSFALEKPFVRTEEVGAVITARIRSDDGDYSDTHARYDYTSVNHFADISAGRHGSGVTLSNPDLAFARLGTSTPAFLDTETPQIHFLAGGQVDGPKLGIPAQNGQHHFLQRFALRPHSGYDQAAAMKFALEHQNPFITGAVIRNGNSAPLPETTHSMLTIHDPAVLLWAFKVHDDGIQHGLVARVWNQSDQPTSLKLDATFPFRAARRLTHLETPLEELPVKQGLLQTELGAQRMETFQFEL